MPGLPMGQPSMERPILEAVVFEEVDSRWLLEAHDRRPIDSNTSHPLESPQPVAVGHSPCMPTGDIAPIRDNMFVNTRWGSHTDGM
jgi:hypothetical protein